MKAALVIFAKAVFYGAMTGAAPYLLLLTLPMGLAFIADGEIMMGLAMILYPLMISTPLVLVASLLFGLPITAVVKHTDDDRERTYALAGLLLGAFIPAAIFLLPGTGGLDALPFFLVPGMLAGGATGMVWGRWREALAAEAASNLAKD